MAIPDSMSVEEVLLKTMDNAEGQPGVMLSSEIRLFHKNLVLEIEGEPCNVYEEQEDADRIGSNILKKLGLIPDYSYVKGKNRYLFRVKLPSSTFMPFLLSIVAAVAVGFLGYLFEENVRTTIMDVVLSPLNEVFLNILRGIAGPMIFLSVAWGIYGIGDAATLKSIGGKLIARFARIVFLIAALVGIASLPVFRLNYSGSLGQNEISSLVEILLGVVPSDVFSPFVNGNTLQIIFLAIVVGIAMLILHEKTEFVANVIEQINYVVQFLIESISKLVPYFIFIVLVKNIWGNAILLTSGIGKLVVYFLISLTILLVFLLCWFSWRLHIHPLLLLRKGLPTLIVGITTASSAAAFGTNLRLCREEFGVDERLTAFGLPLGIVACKPFAAAEFVVLCVFLAECYQVPVSVSWIVIAVLLACILAISAPPIPGGAMTIFVVMFSQLGIPAEGLAVALACDAVFDFVYTGVNQFLIPIILLDQADKLKMVDRSVLLRRRK